MNLQCIPQIILFIERLFFKKISNYINALNHKNSTSIWGYTAQLHILNFGLILFIISIYQFAYLTMHCESATSNSYEL